MQNIIIDITSKDYLDKALEGARHWCQENLHKHLPLKSGIKIDYKIFHYIIDNTITADMCVDERGLIRVSRKRLKWHLEKEELYEKGGSFEGMRKPVKVDPESIFIHEITEFLLWEKSELFVPIIPLKDFFLEYIINADRIASKIENVNRRERALRDWPPY